MGGRKYTATHVHTNTTRAVKLCFFLHVQRTFNEDFPIFFIQYIYHYISNIPCAPVYLYKFECVQIRWGIFFGRPDSAISYRWISISSSTFMAELKTV